LEVAVVVAVAVAVVPAYWTMQRYLTWGWGWGAGLVDGGRSSRTYLVGGGGGGGGGAGFVDTTFPFMVIGEIILISVGSLCKDLSSDPRK